MAEEKEESDEATELADRLGSRFKKKKESGEDVSRLGERLARREEEPESKAEAVEESSISTGDLSEEAEDFFNELVSLSENYPELENVKISDLKKVLAEIGMKHPEEVIQQLKKDKRSIERKEIKDEYTTY